MRLAIGKSVLRVPGEAPERSVAAAGAITGFAALFSAAACCVLPLALGALGLGAGSLAAFVPLRWPLTIASIIAISAAWLFYLRQRRACAQHGSCRTSAPSRVTLFLLSAATVFTIASAGWGYLEAPLMRALGGA